MHAQNTTRFLSIGWSGDQTCSEQGPCRYKRSKAPNHRPLRQCAMLLVEPDVFIARAVVHTVDHDRHPFYLRVAASSPQDCGRSSAARAVLNDLGRKAMAAIRKRSHGS